MPTCPHCGKVYKSDTKYYRNHIDNCPSNPDVIAFNALKYSIQSNIYHARDTATSLIEFLSVLSQEYARVGVLINYARIPPLLFNTSWGYYEWRDIVADIKQTTYNVFGTDSPRKFHHLVNEWDNKLDIHINGMGHNTISTKALPAFHKELMADPTVVLNLTEHKLHTAWNNYTSRVRSQIRYTVNYNEQVTSIENLQKELTSLSADLGKVLTQIKSNLEQQLIYDNLPQDLQGNLPQNLVHYLPSLVSFRPKDVDLRSYYTKALKLTQEANSHIANYPELFI